MTESIKPVEISPEVKAGAQAGVEITTKAPESKVDLLDLYQQAIKDRDKANENAENWKRVGLAKKRGETAPTEITEEEVERRAEERAREMLEVQKAEIARKQSEEIAIKALKENRELKIAMKNKSGVVTTSSSTSTSSVEIKSNPTGWTPEQLADLKKRGVDPIKAWENYSKLRN